MASPKANRKLDDELFRLMDQDEEVQDIDPGLAELMDQDDDEDTASRPNPDQVDPEMEAPARVRMEVGSLEKPEDQLKALRKFYPDAQPTEDGNFLMTDADTGKTIIYNRESWMPSLGDFASIGPEIGEFVGGVGGAVGGATLGSAVGPAGTAAGGIAGAGAGATAGREFTQRGLNWLLGNEDTRTGKEQAWDATKTFALNAAGEGAGMALAKGAGALYRGGRKALVGQVDDAAKAAQRVADSRAIGIEPTAGMVNGDSRIATAEQALATRFGGGKVKNRIADAFTKADDEHLRIIDGLTGGRGTQTQQELGEALQDYALRARDAAKGRSEALYTRTGELTKGVQATGKNVTAELAKLKEQQKLLGKSAQLNTGASYKQAIDQAKAIVDDVRKGADFETLKQARTAIREIANAPGTGSVLKRNLEGISTALTKDMEETATVAGPDALQAWKKANNQYRRRFAEDGVFNEKQSVDPIIKKTTPEEVYGWTLRQSQKGGTQLQAIRRQVEKADGKQAWNDLAASVVDRMGRTATEEGPGEFNPTRFAREWNKMAPEAKDALFKGTERAAYRRDLDRLARIGENLQDYRKLANHSNTAAHTSALKELNPFDKTTIVGTLFLGPGALAASAGAKAANLAAKATRAAMLTDPKVVNMFANIGQEQVQQGGLRKFVTELADYGAKTSNPALRIAINDYLRDINYTENAWER